jgi:putative ATPase
MNHKPLAEILRPRYIDAFVGQTHAVGKNGIVSILLKNKEKTTYFPSLILWGPPGCGKTTLARIISAELNRPFFEFSAVNASIKEIEKEISNFSEKHNPLLISEKSPTLKGTPIIFIDEIHRFNKAQQDALLPHVEQGKFILIGATTENPSFEVIAPLLSRTRVIVLNQLSDVDFLKESSNGDARVAINVLEIASHLAPDKKIDVKIIQQALQKSQLSFDLRGEEYYNTISALHKSMRGSDPNAALYYLARMLEAGQDPVYIARRVVRFASEDVGLKDPQALTLAVAAFQACERLGMPECNLALAEAVVYLAKSPKSNNLYIAYGKAAEDVHKHGNLPVPLHIRNAPTKLMKNIGYGKDYNYYHSPTGEKLPDVEYLPDRLKGTKYL